MSDAVMNLPEDKTITHLFKEQAQSTPDQVAIVYRDKNITYKELDITSNQLAHYLLMRHKIRSEDLISIELNKSEWLIIGLLSILKSGGAYVPVDPNYPEARKRYLEKSSNCRIHIDRAFSKAFSSQKNAYSSEDPKVSILPKHLAYVIYTSGSTGMPKGVMIEHRNVVHLVKSCNFFPLNSNTILLSTAAISFDVITWEFWGTLLNGAKLVLADKEDLLDPFKLKYIINRHQVNSLWMTAPWLHQIIEVDVGIFNGIKQLITGGDVVSPKHMAMLLKAYPDMTIVNGYGPTENTTFSTTYKLTKTPYNTIPIGKPIKNCQAYIIGNSGQLQSMGAKGELCLAGKGLSRGYLNEESLTLKNFIDNPFEKGKKIYRTGDIARWLSDGNIEFLGRQDDQIKIRGHRIELGEVQSILEQQEDLLGQVVVTAETIKEEKVIVAYVVPKGVFNTQELRRRVSKQLPDYMIPNSFVEIKHIPLTPNGKIDKKALLEMRNKLRQSSLIVFRNETEKKLAEIWGELLGIRSIKPNDNFFEREGDSLKAMMLMLRIKESFGVILKFYQIFKFKTLAAQAQIIAQGGERKTLIQSHNWTVKNEVYTPSFAQQRWVITNRINPQGSCDYLIKMLHIPKGMGQEEIRSFFQKMIQKHEG